jgi:hypothetical protein
MDTFNSNQKRVELNSNPSVLEPLAGPTGIEPATYGLRVRRSSLAELRARMLLLKKFSLRNIELVVAIKLEALKVKTNIAEFALVYCGKVFYARQCW